MQQLDKLISDSLIGVLLRKTGVTVSELDMVKESVKTYLPEHPGVTADDLDDLMEPYYRYIEKRTD